LSSSEMSVFFPGIRYSSSDHRPRSTIRHFSEQKGRCGLSFHTTRVPHRGHRTFKSPFLSVTGLPVDPERHPNTSSVSAQRIMPFCVKILLVKQDGLARVLHSHSAFHPLLDQSMDMVIDVFGRNSDSSAEIFNLLPARDVFQVLQPPEVSCAFADLV